MKTRNILMIFFLVVISLAAYVYFFIYHQAHADIFKAQPDFTISAVDLYRAFQEDERAANEVYLGKIIRVSGAVLDIEKEDGLVSAVRLDVGELLDGVVCEMDRVYLREAGELRAGDEVVLQGVCTGFLEDVILNRCAIIEID